MELTTFYSPSVDDLTDTENINFVTELPTINPADSSQSNFIKNFNLSRHIIYTIIGIIIGISNIITLLAVVKFKYLQTPTNVLIVSLAIADFLNAPALIMIKVRDYIDHINESEVYTKLVYGSALACNVVSTLMSIISFFLLSLERWLAVFYPLRFKTSVTFKKTIAVAVISWVYGISLGGVTVLYYIWAAPFSFYQRTVFLAYLMPKPLFIFLAQGHVYFCATVSLILYISIFIKMRRTSSALSTAESSSTVSRNSKQVTEMISITLALFITIWLPYSIVSYYFVDLVSGTVTGFVSFQIFHYVLYSNSFINVFIYAWKSKPFRRAFFTMFGIKQDQESSGTSNTINLSHFVSMNTVPKT